VRKGWWARWLPRVTIRQRSCRRAGAPSSSCCAAADGREVELAAVDRARDRVVRARCSLCRWVAAEILILPIDRNASPKRVACALLTPTYLTPPVGALKFGCACRTAAMAAQMSLSAGTALAPLRCRELEAAAGMVVGKLSLCPGIMHATASYARAAASAVGQ
jgi:hypothetical protein